MTYYAHIENGEINGCGQCKCLDEDIYNLEITEYQYNNIDHYIAEETEIEEEIYVQDYETVTEEYQVQAVDEEGIPIFDIEEQEVQVPVLDEFGNQVFDEYGNPVYTTEIVEVQVPRMITETREVQKPIVVDMERTIVIFIYNKAGEQIGEREETVIDSVPQVHVETVTKTGYRLIEDPNYEEKQAQKERERIAKLHLTRGDVFRGLLQAKGVTRAQLKAVIEALPEETLEQSIAKEMALIDFEEALEFYRGVPLIETVGLQLGITSQQMTRFFETNDYRELMTPEVSNAD